MIKDVYFGKVLDNEDPNKGGGLKVQVDALVHGTELLDAYIPPTFPFAGNNQGFFFLPEPGEFVEVEIESHEERSVEDLSARWRACLYSDKDAIPEEFLSDPTKRGGIKFGDNKLILFEKTKDLVALISNNVRLGEEDCTHPLVRGDTYNEQLDLYLTAEATDATNETAFYTALKGAVTTWSALPAGVPATTDMLIAFATALSSALDPLVSGEPAWAAAIAAFKATEPTWLSTKCKTE